MSQSVGIGNIEARFSSRNMPFRDANQTLSNEILGQAGPKKINLLC